MRRSKKRPRHHKKQQIKRHGMAHCLLMFGPSSQLSKHPPTSGPAAVYCHLAILAFAGRSRSAGKCQDSEVTRTRQK